jgi:PPOX class probable F420-dependent enzyme
MTRDRFSGRNYISLETYKKSGDAVRTPVWFAEHQGLLYAYSLADAGKVKRIRNNPRVRVAPCDIRGNVDGEGVEGRASIADPTTAAFGHQLLGKKYWLKRVGDVFSRLRGRTRAVIVIQLD